MKHIICFIFSSFAISIFAMCPTCKDKGFKDTYVECYLCKGHGTVSPSYYGNAAGVTRWTTTESFINGVKIGEWDSNKKYKKYSFPICPLCKRSKHRGKIHTIEKCQDCEKDLTKENIKNFQRVMSLIRGLDIKYDRELEDFFWTKILYEKNNNWLFNNNTRDKILIQAILDKYDIDSANYAREKSSD